MTIWPVFQKHLPSPSASWSACRLFKQPDPFPKQYGRECGYTSTGMVDSEIGGVAQGWHPLNWALYDRVHCRCACCVLCCSKSALGAIGGSAAIYTLPQLQWLSSPCAFPFWKNRRRGDFEATRSFTRNCNSVLFPFVYSFHHCFVSCQLCRYLRKQPLNYVGVSPLKSCTTILTFTLFFFKLDLETKNFPHWLKFWLDGRILPH